jgi:hypothetical protein
LLVAPRRARTKWTCRTGDDDDTITTTITIGDTVAGGGTTRDVDDTAGDVGDTTAAVAGRGTTGAVAIIAVAVSLTVVVVELVFFVRLHGITGSNLHSSLSSRERSGWSRRRLIAPSRNVSTWV